MFCSQAVKNCALLNCNSHNRWKQTDIQSFGRKVRGQCSTRKTSWHFDSWVYNHFLYDLKESQKGKEVSALEGEKQAVHRIGMCNKTLLNSFLEQLPKILLFFFFFFWLKY